MRKPKELSKKQKEILGEIVYTYLEWKNLKLKLRKLFKEAEKLKIPITQASKPLGISKIAIWRRYKSLDYKERYL
jgi:uncharacterized coiled-coil DUF342 family protein